jgi:hypothetical protein
MAFVNAQQSRIFAGSLAYSGYSRSFSLDTQVDPLEVTTLADTAKQYIVGQNMSSANFELILDAAQFAHAAAWKSTTPQPITYYPNGVALSAECFMVDAFATQFQTSSSVGDVVTATLSTQNTGITDTGITLSTLVAITANTNGTAVDNAASSANGGVAHLHVTAFAGLTSDTITVEHSTNNSTWTTLGTFTAVTGATYQRLEIAAGTTVNRYLRTVDTVVGTGSCTRIVAFARR